MNNNVNRKRKLAFNTTSAMLLQITSIISAFILPRLILSFYGSEVNGLVSSITQILGLITLLDMGVGSVMRSCLYKPLLDKDNVEISKVLMSGKKFYKLIAMILIIYIVLLMCFYPWFANSCYSNVSTALLIAAIGISSFAEYYFGIANALLLIADQKGYIQYGLQIIIQIINVIVSAILIYNGFSIHLVKLLSSMLFLVRPVILNIYVTRYYSIIKKIEYDKEPMEQKWNGMAQHFASVVLNNTDVVILTFFSTLTNVSIYAVYNLVIGGIKKIVSSLTEGLSSLLGEIWARGEKNEIACFFSYLEWVIHFGTIILFGCTSVLICPFVKVYTLGVSDVNYIVPLFALLLTLAHAFHSLRLPYNMLIFAAGQYKQTQHNYIIAAVANVIISVILVFNFGLIGTAIGTFVAMIYQTIWMAWYCSKKLLERTFVLFWKQLLVDIITFISCYIATLWLDLSTLTYLGWTLVAFKCLLVWIAISIIINFIFYKEHTLVLFKKICKKVK